MDTRVIATAELREEVACFGILAVRDDNREQVDLIEHEFAHGSECDAFIHDQRVENHEDGRHAWVQLHVVKEVVRDVRDAEALAVQVGQLLHLKASLLSHSFCNSLS